MSYQALARKWRPRSFDQLVGQAPVRRALINALETGRIHPAYLFTGTRGVGKTTLARLLAKCLNCEQGVSAQPCGECEACREIEEGRFIDLIEVDAASRTKVEDTRELLDNVQYAPVRGRYKVYLIDEVHMLSGHSFNALLKTLEEPPPHVQFLLATTDPQKIPPTILSRCVQFGLKRIPETAIAEHLADVLEREGLTSEPRALTLLATAADGSLRDALSLLDQAVAYGGASVAEADVREMLGTIPRDAVYGMLRGLAAQDGAALLAAVAGLAEAAADFGAVLAELLGVLHRLAVQQVVPESRVDDDPELLELAAALAPEDVQLFYQIALLGRRDLPYAGDPRSGFEMIVLRMLAFRPQSGGPPQAARAGTGAAEVEAPAATRAAPAAREEAAPPRSSAERVAEMFAAEKPPARASARVRTTAEPPVADAAAGEDALVEANDDTPQMPQPARVAAPVEAADVDDDWAARIARMRLSGMAGQLANHCMLDGVQGDQYRLSIARSSESLLNDMSRQRLIEAISALEGRPMRVEFRLVDEIGDTPAAQQQRAAAARQAAAEQAIEDDEAVRAIRERFAAQVVPGSVRPRHDIDHNH
ncbi:DNA polymerase III subunit gamma/tau [Acidihalobacter ferrooxydans]|uniref:DNA polymerase III subunit gamma/tau n=1 Tax=Acidihalobacter ferrooxydans TaxID=1765967 RepID=A0A1P8UG82_9GAMM|nr:DNA polymerase III subunit gamma/tau [Acidihalobacter ferrooxydans]APZ42863.1 DNA polymerase III subunit gamma/tau [Acidihalobacter ferrooxydans]